MASVKVVYDYDAKNPDELTLKTGEIITDVDTSVDGGWWEGVHPSGIKGWFPDNFVEKMATQSKPPPVKKPPPPAASGPPKKLCKCTFEYEAANGDELTLKVGDVIEIISQEEEGWWEGTLNGKTGMFPNNFVEEIVSPPSGGGSGSGSGSGNSANADDGVKAKKVEKVGFGNIFGGGGMPVLRKTGTFSNKEKPDFVKKVAAAKPPPASKPAAAPKLDIVKVEFDYEAANPDELQLSKGQFLNVIKRDTDGWWEGHPMGEPEKKGWFPDNFVVAASDSEKAEFESKAAPSPAPSNDGPPPPRPAGNKPPKAEPVKSGPPPVVSPPPTAAKVAKKPPPPTLAKKQPPPTVAKKSSSIKVKSEPPSVDKPSAPAPSGGADSKAVEAAMKVAQEALTLAKSLETAQKDAKQEIDTLKDNLNKGLDKVKNLVTMLTSDLDTERASTAKMQIELDRLKKLVSL